jgi:sec-independent protein translocase protein TatA
MQGMKDDGAAKDVRTREAAATMPVRTELPGTVSSADGDLTAQLEEEARVAEAHAAELRARARQAGSGSDGLR